MKRRQATDEEVEHYLGDKQAQAAVWARMDELNGLDWSSTPVWHPTHGKAVIRDVASDFDGVWIQLESGDDWWITMTDILNLSTTEPESPCDLYRFFNRKGDLLYVGISANAAKRMAEHKKDKPWWHEVKRVDIERYPYRREAVDAERLAIRTEHPKYNVVHAVKADAQQRTPTARQTWVCRYCKEPIKDGDGYLQVDMGEAIARRHRLDEMVRAKESESNGRLVVWNGSEIMERMTSTARVGWEVLHRDCDTDIGGAQYWIGVERIRTLPQLLDWNSHLSGKDWLNATDWHRFIQHEWAKDAA